MCDDVLWKTVDCRFSAARLTALMPKARRFRIQPPRYSRVMLSKPHSFTRSVNILTEMHRRKIDCPCSKTQQALKTDTCIALNVF